MYYNPLWSFMLWRSLCVCMRVFARAVTGQPCCSHLQSYFS